MCVERGRGSRLAQAVASASSGRRKQWQARAHARALPMHSQPLRQAGPFTPPAFTLPASTLPASTTPAFTLPAAWSKHSPPPPHTCTHRLTLKYSLRSAAAADSRCRGSYVSSPLSRPSPAADSSGKDRRSRLYGCSGQRTVAASGRSCRPCAGASSRWLGAGGVRKCVRAFGVCAPLRGCD